MTYDELQKFFAPDNWLGKGHGPRYSQLLRHVERAILDGRFGAGLQLPPEREIAELAGVSRVTVRKAIGQLVERGHVQQLRGSGSFVTERQRESRLEQSLSTLTSFTEYMETRGYKSTSVVLSRGLFAPRPEEMVSLGLSGEDRVARIVRLRSAGGTPLAIENSNLPADILPDPAAVETSLYQVLRRTGGAPVRAIQRISAANLKAADAEMLELPIGSAVLQIDRTGYLASGRPIEFTRGIYRSDIYDFVAELRIDPR
jgi:GntR family transcriptional regulator